MTAPEEASVWQIEQMGLAGFVNCCSWQPVHGVCPGRRGRGELSSRRWHSKQGSRACPGSVCAKLEKSCAAACGLIKSM